MIECISEIQEYLVKSIKTKAESYKKELGSLYDKLVMLNTRLDITELKELNDLSLFTDYLDYIEAFKNKTLSPKLLSNLDSKYNFAMIVTDDGEAVFDTSIIDNDRETAQEKAWFRDYNSDGALSFEDYEDDIEDESDNINETIDNISNSVFDELNNDDFDNLEDLNDEDALGKTILSEMSDNNKLGISDLNELSAMLDRINNGEEESDYQDNLENEKEYDFFTDFGNDDLDSDLDSDLNNYLENDLDSDLENYLENEHKLRDESESEIKENFDDNIDEKLNDPEFNNSYNNNLKERWGSFKINTPDLKYEDLENFKGPSLAVLIRYGKVSLPEDLSNIPDDIIDSLLEQNVISERPEKKEKEEHSDIDLEISDMESDEDIEENDNKETSEDGIVKQIFKNKEASDLVDSADEWRKKISIMGLNKLKQVNADIIQEECEDK